MDEVAIIAQMKSLLENEKIDDLEVHILDNLPLIDMPLKHTFVPNMYIREICMPVGAVAVSKVHNTKHPYAIMSGCTLVYTPGGGVEELTAGHASITEPGTRRVLYIKEECRWITYHPLNAEEEKARKAGENEKCLLSIIEARIIDKKIVPNSDGKTMFEMYQEKLSEQDKELI